MGRGPPYYSPPEMGPVYARESVWNRPRRLDRRIQELETSGAGAENRLALAKSEQTHYALGLLSVERDLETLDIGDDDDAGEGVRDGVRLDDVGDTGWEG